MRLEFCPNFWWQLPGRKRKKILVRASSAESIYWSERFLLKVYIVICYFSLIIFSTIKLTSLSASWAVLAILDSTARQYSALTLGNIWCPSICPSICPSMRVSWRQQGVQLILAYNWARPAILVAGKGRGRMYFFVSSLSFLFLFLPCPSLSFPLLSLFSLFLGDDTKWPTSRDLPGISGGYPIHQKFQGPLTSRGLGAAGVQGQHPDHIHAISFWQKSVRSG